MRRPRRLSREEAHLWGEIAKLITPLKARAKPKKAAAPEAGTPPRPNPAAAPPPATRPAVKPAAAPAASLSPVVSLPSSGGRPIKLGDLLAAPAAVSSAARAVPARPPAPPALERKERRGLERGRLPIEARIDLHGLYQAEAHAALVGFLMRSRAAGHARVLVVTGKGGGLAGEGSLEGGLSERGVLRRSVPHWLRGPDLRGLVLGFEEAARHHGGAGALYVRLRRR